MHEDSEKRVKYAIDFADPCRVRTTEVSEAVRNQAEQTKKIITKVQSYVSMEACDESTEEKHEH